MKSKICILFSPTNNEQKKKRHEPVFSVSYISPIIKILIFIDLEREKKWKRLRWERESPEKQRSSGRPPSPTQQAQKTTSLARLPMTVPYAFTPMESTISSTSATLVPWNKPRNCAFLILVAHVFRLYLILGSDYLFFLLNCWKFRLRLWSWCYLGCVIYGVWPFPIFVIFCRCLFQES